VANLPPVATGVNDTCGKFATDVNATRGKYDTSCEYLSEFSKKIRNVPYGIIRSLGNLIHVKSLKSNISWHCPFKILK
jgi:hypothetical protein